MPFGALRTEGGKHEALPILPQTEFRTADRPLPHMLVEGTAKRKAAQGQGGPIEGPTITAVAVDVDIRSWGVHFKTGERHNTALLSVGSASMPS
jgi:hypothetical protein